MAYNYGPPPGAYNSRQPSYNYGNSVPPGMGPPPGMDSAPGMQSQSPAGMQHQSQFQAPPMPRNFDFNAPVIRLGVGDQGGKPNTPVDRSRPEGRGSNAEPLGNRNRLGLGASDSRPNIERDRAAVRESMMALQPPTREEVARTIFIGGLGEGAPDDEKIESILRCAGKLRRWTRAKDADDRLCKFGFAEYEDVESLEAANEIYADVEVPVFKNGSVVKDDEGEVKMMKLLVVVDEQSKKYIDEWKGRRKEEEDARQFRMDGCREDLRQSLAALVNVGAYMANGEMNGDAGGDVQMGEANGENGAESAEVVTIPLTLEDELSDIPQEMRATVAEEIKAFRDRSNRRDLERLKREEDIEQAERQRAAGARMNRLASPPPSGAPSGPASAANGIPVGPRDRAVQGAPSGPRGYRGAQLPQDYVNGVSFVGANGTTNGITINREDDDASESDDELERRRQEKRDADLTRDYEIAERKLLARERTRAAAQSREKVREAAEEQQQRNDKEVIAKRLREWNDDEEATLGREEYYDDRSAWLRKRALYRDREAREDNHDRAAEERERADSTRQKAEAKGMADDFLDQMGSELPPGRANRPAAAAPTGIKLALGASAAAQRSAAKPPLSAPRKAMADVEGLLEDEEDAAAAGVKRELKPLSPTTTSTEPVGEDPAVARQELAASIPTSTAELFAYPLKYQYLTPALIDAQIRPFVEKKVVEYLGVQEDLLVDTVVSGLVERKEAREVVGEIEGPLEEEAEVLVRKVWRLAVFWGESGARGLS